MGVVVCGPEVHDTWTKALLSGSEHSVQSSTGPAMFADWVFCRAWAIALDVIIVVIGVFERLAHL